MRSILSSDGRSPVDSTGAPAGLRSAGVGTSASRTIEASAPRTSNRRPPNARMLASAEWAGSPAITWVAPAACVQRSHWPPFCSAWLNSDCAMSLPTPGSSSVTSWSCER